MWLRCWLPEDIDPRPWVERCGYQAAANDHGNAAHVSLPAVPEEVREAQRVLVGYRERADRPLERVEAEAVLEAFDRRWAAATRGGGTPGWTGEADARLALAWPEAPTELLAVVLRRTPAEVLSRAAELNLDVERVVRTAARAACEVVVLPPRARARSGHGRLVGPHARAARARAHKSRGDLGRIDLDLDPTDRAAVGVPEGGWTLRELAAELRVDRKRVSELLEGAPLVQLRAAGSRERHLGVWPAWHVVVALGREIHAERRCALCPRRAERGLRGGPLQFRCRACDARARRARDGISATRDA